MQLRWGSSRRLWEVFGLWVSVFDTQLLWRVLKQFEVGADSAHFLWFYYSVLSLFLWLLKYNMHECSRWNRLHKSRQPCIVRHSWLLVTYLKLSLFLPFNKLIAFWELLRRGLFTRSPLLSLLLLDTKDLVLEETSFRGWYPLLDPWGKALINRGVIRLQVWDDWPSWLSVEV
jgi:hypothetical protein